MKKKKIVLITLLAIVIILVSYKLIGTIMITNKTYEHLETKGYLKEQIKNVKVNHSFLNLILSYDERNIEVEFFAEPDAIFIIKYKNKEIILNSVRTNGNLTKEEIQNLIDTFNSGQITNNLGNDVQDTEIMYKLINIYEYQLDVNLTPKKTKEITDKTDITNISRILSNAERMDHTLSESDNPDYMIETFNDKNVMMHTIDLWIYDLDSAMISYRTMSSMNYYFLSSAETNWLREVMK